MGEAHEEEGAHRSGNGHGAEHTYYLWDRRAVKKELNELFDYAWPVVATMVMYFLANIVTMAFVGQLGSVELAAAGVCVCVCVCVCPCPCVCGAREPS